MNTWSLLKADTHRKYGTFSLGLLIKGAVTCRIFRVIVIMRLCQGAANADGLFKTMLPIFKIIYRIVVYWGGMDLSWHTEIGRGLSIAHGWGLVVSHEVKLGNNITLFHGVTLGRRDRISPEGKRLIGHPVLEDEVWVGPHAIIVGGITIGRGSRIAGGAFVTDNVPPYSVVSGNPAIIIKNDCTPDVMNPALI